MADPEHSKIHTGIIAMEATVPKKKIGWRRKLFSAAEVPLFFYVFALMLQMPVVQQYVYHRISEQQGFHYQYSGSASSCQKEVINKTIKQLQEKVQAQTAHFQIGQSFSYTVPAVVVCLFLGTWSDHVGRKPIILLIFFGGVLEAITITLTMYLKLPVYVIFIGAFLNGASGYFTGLTLAIIAYIADITEKDELALRLGIMEAIIFVGAMLSSFVSGHLINAFGFKIPYLIVLICTILSLLYSFFVLPESLQKSKEERKIGPKAFLKYPRKILWVFKRPRPGRWKIFVMTPAALFINLLTLGISHVIMLYILNAPFCWPSIEIGYFIGTRLVCLGFGAALGIKIFRKCMPEYVLTLLGILSYAGFFSLLAFARNKATLYIACAVGLLSGTCGPVYRSILSRVVDADEQGALFSAVSSLETLFVFAGSFLFNAFYPFANAHGFPGMTFLLNVALLIIPLILNAIYILKIRKENWKNAEDLKGVLDESYDDVNPAVIAKVHDADLSDSSNQCNS